MIVNRQLFEAGADAAVLLEPADALLGHRPPAVSHTIEFHAAFVAGRFVILVRDDRSDALPAEPIAHVLSAVALVGDEFLGLMPPAEPLSPPPDQAGHRLSDDRFGPRRLVHLTGGHFDGERSARTVSNQMEFRAKPASAAAQRVVRRFVGVARETFLSAPAAARAARTWAP